MTILAAAVIMAVAPLRRLIRSLRSEAAQDRAREQAYYEDAR